jgi:hypothetical protein
VIARFFIILFRPRKVIDIIYLNYETKHLFDNSYIIINYRFRNAIYYRFGKYITLEKQIKIFDLKNFDKEFDFVVHGFFRSRTYKLKFEPQLSINTSTFKTTFSNLNLKLEERTIPILTHSLIKSEINKPNIKIPDIKIIQPKIEILKTTFNQNDFI